MEWVMLVSDEAYDAPAKVAEFVESVLGEANLDTYNNTYVVRVTVQKVDKTIG